MDIVNRDIDTVIVDLLDLPKLVNLMVVNWKFYDSIINKPIIYQWHSMQQYIGNCHIDKFFSKICKNGYLEYAQSLVSRYVINIHRYSEYSFYGSCVNGHLDVAKWLIDFGEKSHEKIDIHANDTIFIDICENGHLNIAKWLISLGENGYGKIDIHYSYDFESAFVGACSGGHINIASWLIDLGENGYGKIDIHADNELAFNILCDRGDIDFAKWLIGLGENGYGKMMP